MKSWGRVLLILILLCLLVACDGVGNTPTPIVVTATSLPATATPAVTVTPVLTQGDSNCFGVSFPSGYQWVSSNPCLNGELTFTNSFEGYVNSDGRRQYWYGAEPTPYNHYRGAFTVPLVGTPAWINAGEYAYLGGMYRALNVEVTQINGRVGVEYGQNFQTGACYDFKLFIRSAISQNFNPDNIDFHLEIHTTDGQTTRFNTHSIPNPFASYEFTWRGYHNGRESGQVLMYAEIRFANMHGSIYVFSAGTLRAPTDSCFDGDGLADGVYEF